MVTILTLIGILTALLVSFLAYWSPAHWFLKSIALMCFLMIGVVAYELFVRQMGAPIQAKPQGEYAYVWHEITNKPSIILWAINDRGHRLYEYPYSREEAAMLEEIREARKDGQPPQWLTYDQPEGEDDQLMVLPHHNIIKP